MKFGSSRTSGFRVRTQSPRRDGDGLVLRGRETDILVVVNDLAAVVELFEDIDRAVSRSIVDDDDFLIRILLRQHGFQASLDKSAAIVGYDRDRYEVVCGP